MDISVNTLAVSKRFCKVLYSIYFFLNKQILIYSTHKQKDRNEVSKFGKYVMKVSGNSREWRHQSNCVECAFSLVFCYVLSIKREKFHVVPQTSWCVFLSQLSSWWHNLFSKHNSTHWHAWDGSYYTCSHHSILELLISRKHEIFFCY